MRTNKPIFGLFTIVGILVILLLLRKTAPRPSLPSTQSTPKAQVPQQPRPTSSAKPSKELIEGLARTPVVFFGRVVDETGTPIKEVEVKVVPDNLFGSSDEHKVTTDNNGNFSFQGFEAPGITVYVTPPKGYRLTKESERKVQIADLSGINAGLSEQHAAKPPRPYKPDKTNPMLFFLEKIGPADAMYHTSTSVSLPRDGTPVAMSLDYAPAQSTDAGDSRVNHGKGHCIEFSMVANKEDFKVPTTSNRYRRHFTWSFQIRVLDGGLLPIVRPDSPSGHVWVGEPPPADRAPDPNLVAPEGDYQEGAKFEYAKDMEEKLWKGEHRGEYFLKFKDGTVGRVEFEITPNGSHRVAARTYYNPSGSRNTLYDDSKEIPLIK